MISKTFRSRISHHVLGIAAFCLFSAPAMAQTTFEPTGQWQVGPTQLAEMRGLSGVKLPCVVTNEYDNGFLVRFSGGGGQIMAMAIDFRQDIFREGRKYTAMITMGDSYAKQVSGSAFTPNTMIFNLRALKDFYTVAKSAQEMELSIAGNAIRFTLPGLGKALNTMEQCYAAKEAQPQEEQQFAAQELPQNYNQIIENSAPAEATGSPMNIAQVSPQPRSIPQWNASAGEDIRTVLNRWADRAGYDLQWQADQSGRVAQDMAMDGTFEEAVSQLLATSGVASGITGKINQPQASNALAPVDQGPSADWTAQAGASLQSVLDRWSGQAGIGIVWNASINAPVKQSLTMNGPFEAAVQALLDQYMDDSVRPIGSLNTDPQTGVRTLTIDMDKTG